MKRFTADELELLNKVGFKDLSCLSSFVLSQLGTPISTYGRIEYVFRPATSYPARIYVFIHAEKWLTRNRTVSGCANRPPFYARPMNSDELAYYHFSHRLSALQFESWQDFIESEMWDVKIWDQQIEGFGTAYLHELKAFESKFAPLLGHSKRKNISNGSIQLNLFDH
ncbi:MAG: hypothetical protein M5Z89_08540 [Olivibacter sp.]|nr:hypothetical protein [Olivibacter sp. UJ_SKK_5.1]